jgi:hypothetical protein
MLSPFDLEQLLVTQKIEAAGRARRVRQLAELDETKPKNRSLRGITARTFVRLGLKLDPHAALDFAALAWESP